ncbi:ZIP family metal transporter [Haloactinomyces albus]|uniref:ZIP family zinc transporter n=1 Tax=Haloactinomyces albus TaxID=1352928 RepID=A0AAE3ZAR1_9ACTN|nr:hypothetical protein [Haloactinomyces albus]MDR7300440.1 ZIP family zinc transporter [Haloactinomyces albus]
MSALMITAVAAGPVLAIPAGAGLAMWRPPRPWQASAVQHLAAGLLIGAVALELLAPVSRGSPWAAVLGVGAGLGAVLLLNALSERLRKRGQQSGGMGLAAVVTADLAIDGILLGVAASQDLRLGWLLAIGLVLEDFFTTLSLTISLLENTGRRKITLIAGGIAAGMVLGVVLGAMLAPVLSRFGYHVVLAFGAVALLFLVLEELMREAHQVEETPWATTTLFVGLLGFVLLHMLL